MKKGFTLVELSIVLVIIGLLIGGILTAQSMIGTAKVLMQVRQLEQIDIAVQLYVAVHSKWPGDVNNDRDIGYIATSGQGCGTNWDNNPEVSSFYTDLSRRGFSPDITFTSVVSGNVLRNKGTTRNVMEAAIKSNFSIFASPCPSYDLSPDDNWYEIGDYTTTQYLGDAVDNVGLETDSNFLALDAKIDNGDNDNGNVRFYGGGGSRGYYGVKMRGY